MNLTEILKESLIPELGKWEAITFVKRRFPVFQLPATPEDWKNQAADLRRKALQQVFLRGIPEEIVQALPRVEYAETLETGKGYRIRKLRFEGYPNQWIPTLLYEPSQLSGRVPVVLNPNGHHDGGKAMEYKQVRCINLAKRGILALSPEFIGMGELRADREHNNIAHLDLCGISGVGVFYLHLKRLLDIAVSLEHADPTRLAVTGLSGGGWQTIVLSALDDRVSLAAPNAGYVGIGVRAHCIEDIGDLEQVPSDLCTVLDFTHLTAMLAPRPALLIYNEKDNCCFQTARSKPSVYDPVLPLYKMFGEESRFQFHNNTEPGTHNYDRDNREAFYRFLNRQFFPGRECQDTEISTDGEIRSEKELNVGLSQGNATLLSLAGAAAQGLPHRMPAPLDAGKRAAWQEERRALLREVIRLPDLTLSAKRIGPPRSLGCGLSATSYRYHMSNDWTLPGLVVEAPARTGNTVLVADGGRSSLEKEIREVTAKGHRAISLDLLGTGEFSLDHRYMMLLSSVGARPLGIQAAQLIAVLDWAEETFGDPAVDLHCFGRSVSVAGLCAWSLRPRRLGRCMTEQLPASLKSLIHEGIKYSQCPALFCFGLLEHFDIPDLKGLAMQALEIPG